MIDTSGEERRQAFSVWLRTGRRPTMRPDGVELKFNPYHDPRNGQFTFAPGGPRSLRHVITSDRRLKAKLAQADATTSNETLGAAANGEAVSGPNSPHLSDAVYRPGHTASSLRPINFARNRRARMGGNGGPPLEDWRVLRQLGQPRPDGPAGALFGALDYFLDFTGPATELQAALLDDWTASDIAQIRAIDPDHDFPARLSAGGGEAQSLTSKLAAYNRYKSDLAATRYIFQRDIGALQVETLRVYQQFVDHGFEQALAEVKAGVLYQPRGWSRAQALGTRMDMLARTNMKSWFMANRVNPNQDINVAVNSWLKDVAEGTYTIPDIRVGGVVFDASIARKTAKTKQVKGFYRPPEIKSVFIVRPSRMGGSYFLPRSSE